MKWKVENIKTVVLNENITFARQLGTSGKL